MKTIFLTARILFLLAIPLWLTACQNDDTKAPVLVWRDAFTKDILFTSNDILSFDWDKQVFHLTGDPASKLKHRELVVEDEDGLIYQACWIHPFSSSGCYEIPEYKPQTHLSRQPPSPFIAIDYGDRRRKNNTERENDPRFDPRLKAGLEKAGVIRSINLDSLQIEVKSSWIGSEPKDVGEDLKVWVKFFKHWIMADRKTHVHIYFWGGEKTRKQVDYLALDIEFVANNGTFRSDTRIDNIPVDVIEDGVYKCKFSPWQPVEGSDEYPERGSGLISMTILFQKDGKNVYRLEIPESRIQVINRPETK